MATSLFYWQEKLGKTMPRGINFRYAVNGAKDLGEKIPGYPALVDFDALASQAVIDDFLGTSSEFTLAAFDATSMGADTIGILVNMNKQGQKLIGASAKYYDAAGALVEEVQCLSSATLTDSSNTTECAVGADGNFAARFVFATAGVDIATDGSVYIDLEFISK